MRRRTRPRKLRTSSFFNRNKKIGFSIITVQKLERLVHGWCFSTCIKIGKAPKLARLRNWLVSVLNILAFMRVKITPIDLQKDLEMTHTFWRTRLHAYATKNYYFLNKKTQPRPLHTVEHEVLDILFLFAFFRITVIEQSVTTEYNTNDKINKENFKIYLIW